MATVKTDVATAQSSQSVRDRVDGNSVTGGIRFAEAVLTVGTLAAADIIEIVTLPIGAIVLPERSWVATDGVGGTSAVISKIGDASDDDRYSATSIAITSGGITAVTAANTTSGIVRTPVTSATNTIKATFGLGSGTVTAGQKIRFSIAYILP